VDVRDASKLGGGTYVPAIEGELDIPSDRSFVMEFARQPDGQWQASQVHLKAAKLRKQHNLQGPIDDAFMDSFLFVRPTSQCWSENASRWSNGELTRAIEHWRRHFRGEARVKNDTEVTPQDIAQSNLVLWGDPASNVLLGRIAKQLPIRWTQDEIVAGDDRFPAADHALIAIHPNPLNPSRYVVLNSGFTFRDYAYLNNARQVPMLPDWAVVDLNTPANAIWPGKIAAADFFDEQWQLKIKAP
jgi:hypothetical protein